MRTFFALSIALLLGLGVPSLSKAYPRLWKGTMEIVRHPLDPVDSDTIDIELVALSLGSSNVNASGGGDHLNTLQLSGGISGSATIPVTDPGHPTIFSVRISAALGSGTLRVFSTALPLTQNTVPVHGLIKICILVPDCLSYLPIPLTARGTRGMGIGGSSFTVNTFSKGGVLRLSVQGAPWTLGVASITGLTTETPNGGITTTTRTAQGFAHSPTSATTDSVLTSGVIQLVTPMLITTSLGAPDAVIGLFTTLRIHFVPEPSTLLLGGAGIGFLALGRRRTRL